MFASPVPTQTMFGFDGASVTSPSDVVAPWSNAGAHVTPSLSVFHSPPVAVAAKIVYDLPRGVTTATSVTRPLILVGPRNCHVRFLNGDACFMAWCWSNHLRRSCGSVAVGPGWAGAWPWSETPATAIARQAPSAHRRRRARITDDMGILPIGARRLYHGRPRSRMRTRPHV